LRIFIAAQDISVNNRPPRRVFQDQEDTMKAAASIGAVFLVSLLCATHAHASDPMAVYARVDRVVLEPNSDSPQRIQVWGVFAMAKPDDRNDYLAPVRGYLYLTLAGDSRTVRAEWEDLKQVAGTGQIVAFASRYELKARLRQADERPASPDAYSVNFGLTKVRGRTDYGPIRALAAFKN
jgi:hypothetical protein